MRKCPNCAEENINESLFCKNCGRCLLAPDPETVQRSTAIDTEYFKAPEAIYFYDGEIATNSSIALLKKSHDVKFSVIVKWLLIVNLLVSIIMSQIVIE